MAADCRHAMCSASVPVPNSSGISHPPNATNRAPWSRCQRSRGLWRKSAEASASSLDLHLVVEGCTTRAVAGRSRNGRTGGVPIRAGLPELGDGRINFRDDPLHAENDAQDTLTTAQQVEELLAGMGQDALVVSDNQAGTGYPVAGGPKALDGLAGMP